MRPACQGYEVTIWNGFFAPKGTPKDDHRQAQPGAGHRRSPIEKSVKRLTELAVDLPTPQEATPEALRRQLKASIDKWVPAVKAAGVKPE